VFDEWAQSGLGGVEGPPVIATSAHEFAGADWAISAGREHPADVKTSKRLPTAQEMDVWAKVNADQAIAHADVLVVNGNPIAPVWISEKTRSHDGGEALGLAQAHLPIAATLPAPVLYTATDQYQGRFDFNGRASGPVTVAIAGCAAPALRGFPAILEHYPRWVRYTFLECKSFR